MSKVQLFVFAAASLAATPAWAAALAVPEIGASGSLAAVAAVVAIAALIMERRSK